MDAFYFFEEEIIYKINNSLTQKFNLDNYTAAELSTEIIELFKTYTEHSTELD